MNSIKPIAVLRNASWLAIPKSTRVVVRFDDLRSGLHQECRVERKQGDTAYATLREYGGTRFRLRVDLVRNTIALLSPDYSWLPDAADVPLVVAQKIRTMLATRRSTRAVKISRGRTKL